MNLLPFDYDKMVAEGLQPCTANGTDVYELTKFNTKNIRSLAGILNGLLTTWLISGIHNMTNFHDPAFDLMLRPKQTIKYYPILQNGCLGTWYQTEKELINIQAEGKIKIAGILEITFEGNYPILSFIKNIKSC